MQKIYIFFIFLCLLVLFAGCPGPSFQPKPVPSTVEIIQPIGNPSSTLFPVGTITSSPLVTPLPLTYVSPTPSGYTSPPYTPTPLPTIYPWPIVNYPSIYSIDPLYGASNTVVKIYGNNFNDTRGDGVVLFIKNNISYSAWVYSWSNTYIETNLSSDWEIETYQVIVVVNSRTSNYQYFTLTTASSSSPTPSPTASGTSSSPSGYSFTGKVYNCCSSNTSGETISGATIQITSGASGSATSDSNGQYSFSYTGTSGTILKMKASKTGYATVEEPVAVATYSNAAVLLIPTSIPSIYPSPTPQPVPVNTDTLSAINTPWVVKDVGVGANKPNIFVQYFSPTQTQTLFNFPNSATGVSFGCFSNSSDPEDMHTPGGTFMILPITKDYLDSTGYGTIDSNGDHTTNGEQGTGTKAKLKTGDIIPVFKYNFGMWQAAVPGIVVKADFAANAELLSKMLADALLRGIDPGLVPNGAKAGEVNNRFAVMAPLPSYGFFGACVPGNSASGLTSVIQF